MKGLKIYCDKSTVLVGNHNANCDYKSLNISDVGMKVQSTALHMVAVVRGGGGVLVFKNG